MSAQSDKKKQHGGALASMLHHLRKHVVGHFRNGLWVVLVMTALTQFLHSRHLDAVHQLDNYFTAHVVKRLHRVLGADQRPIAPGPAALSVQLLEISPELRVLAMEEPSPSVGSIQRLQGIRPISRSAMAELLDTLADCLEKECAGTTTQIGRPQVLAIDIDLMPLPGDAHEAGTAMQAVLKRLRQHLDVVLIVLNRNTPEATTLRNEFIRTVGCTSSTDAPIWRQPGQPGGLFLASPRLLARPGEGPLQFAEHGIARIEKNSQRAPAWFPSLGNLSYLLWRYHGTPTSADGALRAAWLGLTQLCDEVGADPATASILLEDRITKEELSGELDSWINTRWRSRLYNWRLLDSEQLRFSPLALPTQDEVAPKQAEALAMIKQQIGQSELTAPVLMLSIDGGVGNDKFLTPAAVPLAITGGSFHALQALSIDQSMSDKGPAVLIGVVVDALLGLAFLLCWALLGSLLSPYHAAWPRCTRLASAVMPPVLAGLIVFASLWIAALLMRCDIWFNPVYVMLGMMVHAYIEGWQHGDSPLAHIDPWGLQALRRWRKARDAINAPATKDALAAAALRWAALLLGLYGLSINVFTA